MNLPSEQESKRTEAVDSDQLPVRRENLPLAQKVELNDRR